LNYSRLHKKEAANRSHLEAMYLKEHLGQGTSRAGETRRLPSHRPDVQGLSGAQWAFKPAPDRWSIAEIVEHMIFVQERVLGPLRDQLAAAPAVPAGYDYRQVDVVVIRSGTPGTPHLTAYDN
jgi:hypothetical protein